MQERCKIGVVIGNANSPHAVKIMKGIDQASKECDVQLMYFMNVSSPYTAQLYPPDTSIGWDYQKSAIYDYARYVKADVLIMTYGMMSIFMKSDYGKQYLEYFRNVPCVLINEQTDRPNWTSIIIDNYNGIYELVEHLVRDHGYHNFAFLAGPPGNTDACQRKRAFLDVMKKYDLPMDESRIETGDFSECVQKQVNALLDRIPNLQAIVCANDVMALTAYQECEKRGLHIGQDIAVTGFDGIEEALDFYPPITTVRYDIDATISRTFRIMRNLLQGKEIDEPLEIVAEIVYGSSCGCQSNKQNSMTKYNNRTHKLHSRLNDHRHFSETQIYMAADLTDNDSFFGVFNNLMQYADEFRSNKFWLCIVDDFLVEQEELSDIIDKANFHRSGYSDKMNIMLSRINGEWQGLIDFNTSALLPNLSTILEDEDALMFCPLHVLDMTIGYVVLAYDSEMMNMEYLYQFLMNISNALENTKTHQRQQNIISSLENKYIHDPMTGLFNRRGFYQRVQPLFEQCAKTNTPFVLVSADLNGLKTINDTYGHADGDIAISTVGQALAQESSASATCARFGGDEFVAAWACNSSSSEEEAAFRKRIQNYLDEFNASSGKPYTISSSLGIVVAVPSEDITLDEFIKVTDEKMYEEKVKYHQTHKR